MRLALALHSRTALPGALPGALRSVAQGLGWPWAADGMGCGGRCGERRWPCGSEGPRH